MTTTNPATTREFNFDGIVGPTHNYAGLSYGNIASTSHKNLPSHPRAAALQGLEKMKRLAELGIDQAVLPPLRRPSFGFLRGGGFDGTDCQVIEKAAAADSMLVAAAFSASNMWAANAATVSPSPDCADGRLHLTVANLNSTLHRRLEPPATTKVLQFIFGDPNRFCVHPALPADGFADEGAANHMRFAAGHALSGIECFVYGRIDTRTANQMSARFPATRFPVRQTLEASQSIARWHQLAPSNTLYIQQSPEAIDAGVFHNDVIAVGNENVLLCHELAFVDQARTIAELRRQFAQQNNQPLHVIQISTADLSLANAVKSYLFNSQLVTRPDGNMSLICPAECDEMAAAKRCIQAIVDGDNPVDQVEYVNLRQSMQNGGGPACLRLRVVLTDAEQAAMHQAIVFHHALYERLVVWVKRHYREQLSPDDLRDPNLVAEVNAALDDLAEILQLPADLL